MTQSLTFVNWSHRPAVIVGEEAFAVLRPGTGWVSVDRWDVGQTGAVFSERHWRQYFHRERYSRLDLDVWRFRNFEQDNEKQDRPPPTAADFDNAVRACVAAQKARAPEPVSKKTYDLDKSPEAVENRTMLEEMERTRKAKEKTYDLDNSPEAVENRDILSMFAKQRAREAASSVPELPEDEVPPTAPV